VKPRVGISACLLGEAVRYDGGHKLDKPLLDALGPLVEWVPVCPEVESGMPVPRPTLDVRRDAPGEAPRVVIHGTGEDVTAMLIDWSSRRLDDLEALALSGFVLKSRSPSCGLLPRDGRGIFAAALTERFPDLPVREEGELTDAAARQRFLEAVLAHAAG
jgi:uncharacterized protein YbbK (DUF523 family)